MICISIAARTTDEAIQKMIRAKSLADTIEIRLDLMGEFDLKEIIASAPRPILVTYRSKKEGGSGTAGYGTRVQYLRDAVEAGADYVDLEFSIPLEHRQVIIQDRGSCQIVLSAHLLNRTPSSENLERLFRKMAATGLDIIKIVTWAKEWEDNFRVLKLIPRAQALNTKITAFCMGPLGRISRILCPLMGGHMTFASLEKGEESAAGQISAFDMKKVLEILSS